MTRNEKSEKSKNMKNHNIEKTLLVKMLKQTKWFKYYSTGFDDRRISIHTSDGYNSPENRTTFFCVEGSPNKIFGWINEDEHSLHRDYWEMVTNHGKAYFSRDGRKVTKDVYRGFDVDKDIPKDGKWMDEIAKEIVSKLQYRCSE